MTTPLVFPASKTKEIAMQDPDVKELSKQSVELLRSAAQYFAENLFARCFDEAGHRAAKSNKKQTQTIANMNDFLSAVQNDESLSMMLGPFLGDPEDIPEETNHEEDDAEEIPQKPLEEIIQEDDSDSSGEEEEEEEEANEEA